MPEPIDVYLLAGQSNMSGFGEAEHAPADLRQPHPTARIYFAPLDEPDHERARRPHARRWSPLTLGSGQQEFGFGPELSLGFALADATPSRRVALIKSDRGGTGLLRDWRPADTDDADTLSNAMLRHAADAIEQLLEDGLDPRLAGFVWYQGEADTRAENDRADDYAAALDRLITRVAEELNDGEDFSKALVRVHPHDVESPHYDTVRRALMERGDADERAAWINVDDLHYPDRLHLDGPSLITLGQRIAAAVMPRSSEVQPHAPAVPAIAEPPPPVPPQVEASAISDAEDEAEAASAPHPDAQLPKPAAPRVLALMNQKGGVGKTTTAVNVGAALANLGLNVLCIDLDPQAHLTLSLGIEPEQIDKSNYDLLTDPDTTAMEVVRYTARDDQRLAVLPAETNLAGVESELADQVATGLAQTILRNKTADLVQQFDYVLLDCPPSLGLLTINALTMAQQIVVPMQAHFLALQGMTKLFETIGMVRQGINPDLTVAGVVLCMHEGNTLLANEVIGELEGFFRGARGTDQPWAEGQVFQPPIRRNIKLAEAPSFGQSVHAYAPGSNGARDYLAVARSIAAGSSADL
jgi:chromosome partitioning protein